METRFSKGVQLGVNEEEYQAALKDYRDGLVLGLHRSRKGQWTLHKATCVTVSYDLSAKNTLKRHTRRSGKVLFHDITELEQWLSEQTDVTVGDLNACSRCK